MRMTVGGGLETTRSCIFFAQSSKSFVHGNLRLRWRRFILSRWRAEFLEVKAFELLEIRAHDTHAYHVLPHVSTCQDRSGCHKGRYCGRTL
jgi:hypothetical protein